MEPNYTIKPGLIKLISERSKKSVKAMIEELEVNRVTLTRIDNNENCTLSTLLKILNQYEKYVTIGDVINYKGRKLELPLPRIEEDRRNYEVVVGNKVDVDQSYINLKKEYARLLAKLESANIEDGDIIDEIKKQYHESFVAELSASTKDLVAEFEKKIEDKNNEIIEIKAQNIALKDRLKDLGYSLPTYPTAVAQADSEYHANKK